MILDQPPQLDQFKGRTVFLYPIFQDAQQHGHVLKVIGLVIIDVDTKKVTTLSMGHPEGVYQYVGSLEFLAGSVVYSYDTQVLQYAGFDTSYFIDSQAQYYLYSNQACNFETPAIINHYNRLYANCSVLGSLVSLDKHAEIALDLFRNIFVREIQPGLSYYQTTLLSSLHEIEKSGLKVNSKLFTEHFGSTPALVGDYAFTQYNPYTLTGRPSNRFGGVNFAALNKDDGSRDCFISRFGEDGILVEIDFNAYHPRLIASMVGYTFDPHESAYQHLATQYYRSTPTKEQVAQMKEATFRQIYGGVQSQYLNIPFFYAADELAKLLWETFQSQGFIESPVSQRKIRREHHPDITKSLLFNYYIQMYETECNMVILKNIHASVGALKSRVILYTYDSILFDVLKSEKDSLLEQLRFKHINTAKFPIKIKEGLSYGSLAVY